ISLDSFDTARIIFLLQRQCGLLYCRLGSEWCSQKISPTTFRSPASICAAPGLLATFGVRPSSNATVTPFGDRVAPEGTRSDRMEQGSSEQTAGRSFFLLATG